MTAAELQAFLASTFESAGMTRRRGVWHWSSPELTWLIELDRSPHGERYGVDLGVDLHRLSASVGARRPTDCPLLVHLENLPVDPQISKTDVLRALDLTYEMPDADREKIVRAVADAVAGYVRETATVAELRARFNAGELRSAFVRKDLREVLEAS